MNDTRPPGDAPALPAPFPSEDPPRRCDQCGRLRYDTRTRINRTGLPVLCRPCFEPVTKAGKVTT